MGMFKAIIPDELLHPTGVFKERLSQSTLYAAMQQVAEAEAHAVLQWYLKKGVRFHWGRDEATELTEAQIAEALNESERLSQQDYAPQSVVAAWAATESAMRHRIRAQGGKTAWGANSFRSMLNELLSSGALSSSDYRRLLDLARLRDMIVHGFAVPEIDPGVVPFLTGAARQLLADAKAMEQAS